MEDINYIADYKLLKKICLGLKDSKWLAVDTEFIREKTYFPQLALLQITDAETIYCIDPLAIDDLTPFYELIESEKIIKVFHAATQDLEIFYHKRKRVPQPIFDTQVAAALLGLGEQIGYASLVKKMLSVELDKSHTRTDWTQRPLQDEQIHYAADDVRYLSNIYPLLVNKLDKLDRLTWMDSEQIRLQDKKNYQPDPDNSWQRIKGAGKLRRQQLNVLRHLAAWREQQAIQFNRPRRWILADKILLDLAMLQPKERTQLAQIRMLESKLAERYAEDLLHAILQAQNESKESWPDMPRPEKPSAQEDATVDLLIAVAHLRAEEYQLSAGQITSRSELLKFVRGEENLPLFKGWRLDIAGQVIKDTFHGKMQLVCDQGRTVLQSR